MHDIEQQEKSAMSKVSPYLLFDNQAEEAVQLYTSVFPRSKVIAVQRHGAGGPGPEGAVMIINFELDGLPFTALNGGPQNYNFNDSVSFVVSCADQAEVDAYWDALTANGGKPGQCGWLKDKFGLSWQIVPKALTDLLADPDPVKAGRVAQAMLQMTKINVAALQAAHRA